MLMALAGFLWALGGAAIAGAQTPGELAWRQANGPVGGSINDLTIHPPTGHLFAGTHSGLFRSTNDGTTWELAAFDGFWVREVLVDSKGTLYASTFNEGLFRSTDAGTTWHALDTGLPSGYLYLAVDRFDRLWTSVNYWDREAQKDRNVVLRSADGGQTWETLSLPDNALVATVLVFPGTGHLVAGDVRGRVFLSTNDGASWTPSNTGLPEYAWGAESLVLDRRTGALYVGFISDRLYRSMDGGRTWESLGFPHDCVNDLILDRDGNIFAGTPQHGLYRSTDGGTTWEEAHQGLPNVPLDEPYYLAVNALALTAEGHLMAGTQGDGVYRSVDQAQAWIPRNIGLVASRITTLSVAPGGTLYAGVPGGQLFTSSDRGETWTRTSVPSFSINDIVVDEDGRLFIASGQWGTPVLRSTDGGVRWEALLTGFQDDSANDLALSPEGHLYAATQTGLYRSMDQGTTWRSLLQGPEDDQNIQAVVLGPAGEIYAATYQYVYHSDDDGQTWTGVLFDDEHANLRALLVTEDGHVLVANYQTIHRSADQGATWQVVHRREDGPHLSMLFAGPGGVLFAGTYEAGLLRSTDGGATWHPAGLAVRSIRALALDPSSGYLYAGTGASGVFRARLFVDTGIAERLGPVPEAAGRLTNYPNPFRAGTTIAFDVTEPTHVRLVVFDALGRTVAALVDGPMEPGAYRVPFAADHLPSGVYVYRLEAGSRSVTQTMLHVR